VALLAAARRAGQQRDDVAARAQRVLTERGDEELLALPARHAAGDGGDEGVRRQAQLAARRTAVHVARVDGDRVVEDERLARAVELGAGRVRHARQRRREQQAPVGRPPALEAGVDLAHVPDMGDARDAGRRGAPERDRRVRVHERHSARARHAPEAAGIGRPRRRDAAHARRRHQRPAQHRQRPDLDLDAGGAQVGSQLAVVGQHDERPVALGVKTGDDRAQLAVCSVAPRRGVQVEDRARDQASTSYTVPGASGTRSG
jgi:hypothetical protein